jgi:hypothetical protein
VRRRIEVRRDGPIDRLRARVDRSQDVIRSSTGSRSAIPNPPDSNAAAEIERVRNDKDFTARASRLLTRDKELLERLAQ